MQASSLLPEWITIFNPTQSRYSNSLETLWATDLRGGRRRMRDVLPHVRCMRENPDEYDYAGNKKSSAVVFSNLVVRLHATAITAYRSVAAC